jgi:hypothetical protein
MNIFILDTDIKKCARYHSDKHVVKMILESAQILCSVLHQNGIDAPYKPTHTKHPATLWAGVSLSNWSWLKLLALELNREYKYRFNRQNDHRSAEVIRDLEPPPIQDIGLTEFVQTMPDIHKIPGNPVLAYRQFYVAEKAGFAKWTKRPVPEWFQSMRRTSE